MHVSKLSQALDKVVYIGLSLLCCRHCIRAITAFNAIAQGGVTVAVAGKHDIPCEPRAWLIPRFLRDKDHTEASDAFFAQYTEGKIGFVVSFDPNIPVDGVRPSVLRLAEK